MFIAVAVMCMSIDLKTCSQMLWQKPFLTQQACESHNESMIGTMGPKGIIVMASCFEFGTAA